jgi:hypothetical protein
MTQPIRSNPVQSRAVQTLQRIETAALEVLVEQGRDRFSTSDVAANAGCAIGTVYRYFSDRVALLDHIWPDRDRSVPGKSTLPKLIVGEKATVTGTVHSYQIQDEKAGESDLPGRLVVTVLLDAEPKSEHAPVEQNPN